MLIVFDAYGTLWDVTALEVRCREVVGPDDAGPTRVLLRTAIPPCWPKA
ncbi:hypothetical protein Sulac_3559 (plasmid) [Sulfobacillus acidophilus DSM 10332]|uniref:Uncharacterized protein n=1 Tax=Sulfobacillus acidophilus (strain ATCC 700253 / DSM 10332 / NAL) TaxID=679936 RepID=G8U1R4_SULAD|nr:hypothetical protein Sulac_3559 [Sulfobacillus acidophilus DSM 10332]